jgi:hypothetical protein
MLVCAPPIKENIKYGIGKSKKILEERGKAEKRLIMPLLTTTPINFGQAKKRP